jgi:5'-nucleotidase
MSPSSSTSPIITQAAVHGPPHLRFLHFNDVYHIEAGSRDPVGGAARFQTLVDYYRSDAAFANSPALLTFFSGDAFNPSLESSVTKGRHMVPILNGIGTDVACVGVRSHTAFN